MCGPTDTQTNEQYQPGPDTGFLMVKLRPLGSLFRGKMSKRGPLVIQMHGAICSRQSGTKPSFFRSPSFIMGNFKHTEAKGIK